MNLIQIQNAHKSFGTKILFQNASLAINEGEHIGVIGPNGAGKTTLLKALIGQMELESGEIVRSKSLRLAYLEQEAEWNTDLKVEDFLAENCVVPLWTLKQLSLKLGLTAEQFEMPLKSLSGGFRMRVKLLQMIGMDPNLMMLDEPTNFLDLESLLVLENFLQDYKGAFLIISHDREFLARVTDHVVEVEGGEITKFPGTINDYFEQKSQLQELLQKQVLAQEAKRAQVMDFVRRFGAKATKAKQAQSRMRQLEKMEHVELKNLPNRARIQIPAALPTGRHVLELRHGNCGYSGHAILKDVNLILERGQHLGIVGHNGAGKSTLLKSLAGALPLIGGELKIGYQVEVALFSQHSTDQLDLGDTVFESLQKAAHRSVTQQEILNVAGSLLFQGDDIQKPIRVLSGGEKTRVALGQILLKKVPCLLLDEPTNHLDFDTVEALTLALAEYEGSIVAVSHDRAFISRIAKSILEVENGHLTLYPGTYEEYVWSLQKGILSDRELQNIEDALPSKAGKTAAGVANEPPVKFNYKEEKKKLDSLIRETMKSISGFEKRTFDLAQKQHELTEQIANMDAMAAKAASLELGRLGQELVSSEEALLELYVQLEENQKRLESLTTVLK